MAPGEAPLGEPFDRLKPGDRLFVRPSIPRHAERHEYQVNRVDRGVAVLKTPHFDEPLRISARAVAQLESTGDRRPLVLVLKGRLQWITAGGQWVLRPEEPSPENEFGLAKLASPEDPRVVKLVDRLRQEGWSPWWVPLEAVQEFLTQGGEIVYDEDGCYLRTKRHDSEWILLGRRPAAVAFPPP